MIALPELVVRCEVVVSLRGRVMLVGGDDSVTELVDHGSGDVRADWNESKMDDEGVW